jgi:hypothetical protein
MLIEPTSMPRIKGSHLPRKFIPIDENAYNPRAGMRKAGDPAGYGILSRGGTRVSCPIG